MKRKLFGFIWELSERSGFGLGRFAPYVFERMCGLERHKRTQVIKGSNNVVQVKIRNAK